MSLINCKIWLLRTKTLQPDISFFPQVKLCPPPKKKRQRGENKAVIVIFMVICEITIC